MSIDHPDPQEHERAMAEVSQVLMGVDHAHSRALKAQALLRRSDAPARFDSALTILIDRLALAQKEFMQATYYSP